jgi:hypothetical protein
MYDPCASQQSTVQSIDAGTYQLETPRPHCEPCFIDDPAMRLQRVGASTCGNASLIDVDSELMGLTRRYTRCQEEHVPLVCKPSAPMATCQTFISREDTRLSNPPCTLRATGWNRWEWLNENPQRHAIPEFPIEVQYRLIVKDNHRPIVPNILDESMAYPHADGDDRVKWSCNEKPFPTTTWRSCEEIARL